MSVFQNLKAVTVKINITVEVHFLESLHWDFVLSTVFDTIGILVEGKVVLNRATWVTGLLILARSEGRSDTPEGHKDWDGGENGKKDSSLPAATDLPGEVCRNQAKQ